MKNLIIPQSTSIKQSLNKLEKNNEKCLLVISKKGTLIGTLNDGDIIRAIIKGLENSPAIAILKFKNI